MNPREAPTANIAASVGAMDSAKPSAGQAGRIGDQVGRVNYQDDS